MTRNYIPLQRVDALDALSLCSSWRKDLSREMRSKIDNIWTACCLIIKYKGQVGCCEVESLS